jgi:peptide-methionine (S)-S-oxide reductase
LNYSEKSAATYRICYIRIMIHHKTKLLFLYAAAIILIGSASAFASGQTGNTTMDNTKDERYETATLGGGCFWCLEAVYERIDGIDSVISGYAGGATPNPTYQDVSAGATGHAEVVQVNYDPKKISYDKVLDLFWTAHDPTTLNRQGADVGTQYRSVIFYENDSQRKIAEKSLKKHDSDEKYSDPIVTEIKPIETFYEAEGYHQDYYEKNPYAGYCMVVIKPKLQKLGLDIESLM